MMILKVVLLILVLIVFLCMALTKIEMLKNMNIECPDIKEPEELEDWAD